MGTVLPSDMARPAGRPAIVATTNDDLTDEDKTKLISAITAGLDLPEWREDNKDEWTDVFRSIKGRRESTINGIRVFHYHYELSRSGRYGVAFPDDRTVVAAPLDHLKRMLTVRKQNPLATRLRDGLKTTDLFGTMPGLSAERILSGLYLAMGGGLGGISGASSYTVRCSLASDPLLSVDVRCRRDQKLTYSLFSVGRSIRRVPFVASLGLTPSVDRDDEGVSVKINRPKNWLASLKQSRTVRAQAAFKKRIDHLESIAFGFSEFTGPYARYPSYNKTDQEEENKRNGHSWRVYLLPFVGELDLQLEYRFEESWDSPHNKALIARMPDCFKSRGVTKPGYTSIHVFRGTGAPFENTGKNVERGSLQNRQSTISVVEAGPDTATPWTKPDALVYDRTNPKGALGNINWPLRCVMFDGTVVEIPKSVSDTVLRALIEHADGKAGNLSGFKVLNP